jgi:biopolymer transport protein ExbD
MGAKLAGGGGGKGMQPNSEPNVIPFIDIMLVLLIIFMVASPPPTVDIKVDIPPLNTPPPPDRPIDRPTIVIQQVDAAGVPTYQIGEDRTQLALEELGPKLRDVAFANNPSKQNDPQKLFLEGKIVVRGHNEADYAEVIRLMEAIDKAGFKAVSLSIQPPEDGS